MATSNTDNKATERAIYVETMSYTRKGDYRATLADGRQLFPTELDQIWNQTNLLASAPDPLLVPNGGPIGLVPTELVQMTLRPVSGSTLKFEQDPTVAPPPPGRLNRVIPATYGDRDNVPGAYQPVLTASVGGTVPYDGHTWVVDGLNHYVEFPYGVPARYGGTFTLHFYRYTGTVGGIGVTVEEWHYNPDVTGTTLCPDPAYPLAVSPSDFVAPLPAQSTEGAGTRIMLDESKGAIRAGTVSGAQWDDANRGQNSVAFGSDTLAVADYSTVCGGLGNSVAASANFSAIGGGSSNQIVDTASSSVICGGSDNVIESDNYASNIAGGAVNIVDNTCTYCAIGGGTVNQIKPGSSASVVCGGQGNYIFDGVDHSSIGGGQSNYVYAPYGSICGGQSNSVTGTRCFIGSGRFNAITSDYCAIVGGGAPPGMFINAGHRASGYGAYVGGGGYEYTYQAADTGHTASGKLSTICGGGISRSAVPNPAAPIACHIASGDFSFVGGGGGTGVANLNRATGPTSTLCGGSGNLASGSYSVVVGGGGSTVGDLTNIGHTASGFGAFVGGGGYEFAYRSTDQGHQANGKFSTICGGGLSIAADPGSAFFTHLAQGDFAFIGGGGGTSISDRNVANGLCSCICGGGRQLVLSQYGTICGGLHNVAFATATYGVIAGGDDHTIGGVCAAIGGGSYNIIGDHLNGTIGGGDHNGVSADYATVGGGYHHTNNGTYGFIGGGEYNNINVLAASHCTIGGGTHNVAFVRLSTIGGGGRNEIRGILSTIAGGGVDSAIIGAIGNEAPGFGCFIGGGGSEYPYTTSDRGHQASGKFATICGGGVSVTADPSALILGHCASGDYSFIGGGGIAVGAVGATTGHLASGDYSFIGGGGGTTLSDINTVQGTAGTICGGSQNTVEPSYGFIGGGNRNSVTDVALYGTIAGGNRNSVLSLEGFIGGGQGNIIDSSSDGSVIGGGDSNGITAATYATIGGGLGNIHNSATYATIGGGYGNGASGSASAIGGGGNNLATGILSTISGGGAPRVVSVIGNTASGLGSFIGGGGLGFGYAAGDIGHRASGKFSTICGGGISVSPDPSAPIVAHLASGDYSFIGGGGGTTLSDVNTVQGTAGTICGGSQNIVEPSYGFIGGGNINSVTGVALYGTIAGGHGNSVLSLEGFIGGGQGNIMNSTSDDSVIGGGFNNNITAATYATIGGGYGNIIADAYVTISGGNGNSASGLASAIGGGHSNSIAAAATYSTIAGGELNAISETYSTIGGGTLNSTTGQGSTIPGGWKNFSTGNGVFMCGAPAGLAKNDDGGGANQFIWGDSVGLDLRAVTWGAAVTPDSVWFAGGGGTAPGSPVYTILSTNARTAATAVGVQLVQGAAAWAGLCDRNAKENITELDPIKILTDVESLPIFEYNFKNTPQGMKCRGPMAQDWHALFPSEYKPKNRIDTMDLDGIALASIKGLAMRLKSAFERITVLESLLQK